MRLLATIVPPFDLVCAVTCNLHSTGHWSKLHFFRLYFLSFLFVRLFIDFVFRWLVFHQILKKRDFFLKMCGCTD